MSMVWSGRLALLIEIVLGLRDYGHEWLYNPLHFFASATFGFLHYSGSAFRRGLRQVNTSYRFCVGEGRASGHFARFGWKPALAIQFLGFDSLGRCHLIGRAPRIHAKDLTFLFLQNFAASHLTPESSALLWQLSPSPFQNLKNCFTPKQSIGSRQKRWNVLRSSISLLWNS